jgi:hypothetical protein
VSAKRKSTNLTSLSLTIFKTSAAVLAILDLLNEMGVAGRSCATRQILPGLLAGSMPAAKTRWPRLQTLNAVGKASIVSLAPVALEAPF